MHQVQLTLDDALAHLTLADRLWAKVDKEFHTGCWLWLGWVNNKGYGGIRESRVNGRRDRLLLVHRVAYELERGPIPDGMTIDHLCRVTICCNPEHLEVVTGAENTRRGVPFRGPRLPRGVG